MKRPLVITLNVLSWTAILVYLLLSSRYTRERKQQRPCREVRVVVLDSAERGFITPAMVRGWFASEKIPLVGRELSSINTLELERFVRRRGYVRSARVYASIDGVLTIEIAQRKPVMRFNTDELENPFELGSGIGSRALGVQMVYVNVLQLAVAAPLAHGLDQALRSAGHAAQMDVVMAFDCPDGLLGRDEMDRFGHCV